MDSNQLLEALGAEEQFKEIWLERSDGSRICALVNGDLGWLMYIQNENGSSFSTRNPAETSNGEIDFLLNNGQRDSYPKKWLYPVSVLKPAMLSFIRNKGLPEQVIWENDSK